MTVKLIMVDGLPGSGKSTTAQTVYDVLKAKNIDVELYSEGNYNHPADFDGVAYFDNDKFDKLKERHIRSNELLNKIKIKNNNGYLIPYRKAMEEDKVSFQKELLKDITKNDVYEVPLDIHIELILNRWDEFAKKYINGDKVVIFDCCFIQNPVTVTMIRNNSPKEVTKNYINELSNRIKGLNPILIYVDQDNIKESFNKVIGERPKEWFDGFTYYYTNNGYGQANNLKGLDGVLKVLEERNKLEREIYDELKITKYKINNSSFNMDLLKEKVLKVIENNL